MPDGAATCESCAKPYQAVRGGCAYCITCCQRWHFDVMGDGPTIHSAESQGQSGR